MAVCGVSLSVQYRVNCFHCTIFRAARQGKNRNLPAQFLWDKGNGSAAAIGESEKSRRSFVRMRRAAKFLCGRLNYLYRFTLAGERAVRAERTGGFYIDIDLGIVKYHFEQGAGRENFDWE